MSAQTSKQVKLDRHVNRLLRCRRCPRMKSTPVSGGAIVSEIMIVGQAPGPREPVLQRPFAHTAGKTLFRWFEEFCRMNEAAVRSKIYFAAVCRCFPGKNSGGTDRVPAPDEIRNCSSWMDDEIGILRPRLIIPVGRLAITQFIDCAKLETVIGRKFRVQRAGHLFDMIPLPHPSSASPWHKIAPGKELLGRALKLIARHSAVAALCHAEAMRRRASADGGHQPPPRLRRDK
jgi:uracil-DNA glycosylase